MGSRVSKLLVGIGLLAAVVGAAITGSLLTSSGAGREATHRAGTVAAYLALTCALTVVSLALRWVRWNNLVRRCGARLPTRDGAKLYAATLPAILTPFYVGELVRAAVLARRHPGRGWSFTVVWAIERLGDLMAATTIWAALGSSPWLVPICAAAWALAHLTLAAVAGSDDHSLGTPGAVALTMALSLLGWAMPGVALNLVAHGFGSPHALGGLFYRSTVLGGLTGSPLGVGVTGVLFIHGLEHLGMAARGATLAVATFRAGTSWFALTAGLLALGAWRRSVFSAPAPVPTEVHFDAIASSYADQIPEFTRRRLIERKVRNIRDAVPSSTRGLEIGCGQGWYASALANEGFSIVACDASRAQVMAAASAERLGLAVCDSARLPYADCTFAFAYAINVVHHITDASRRQQTLREVVRVLKPGGVFVLEEMNTTNPLFRFYMGYVFPLLHRIDEGTELWIQPRDLPPVPGASWSPTIDYMTFLPEFASPLVVRLLGPLERRLEQSRARAWSAHYAARLVKNPR